jgi:hypothetical protein
MSLIRAFESTSIIEHRRHSHRHALSFIGYSVIYLSSSSPAIAKISVREPVLLYANKTTIKSDYNINQPL